MLHLLSRCSATAYNDFWLLWARHKGITDGALDLWMILNCYFTPHKQQFSSIWMCVHTMQFFIGVWINEPVPVLMLKQNMIGYGENMLRLVSEMAVIWLAWVDFGWSPHICGFVSVLTLKNVSKSTNAHSDSRMNANQSCVCDIRYLWISFYFICQCLMFVNLFTFICG